jgi:hypothetical protein
MPNQTNFYEITLSTGTSSNLYAYNVVSTYAPGSCYPASMFGPAHCNTSLCRFGIASSPPYCNLHVSNGNNGGSDTFVGYSNLFQK